MNLDGKEMFDFESFNNGMLYGRWVDYKLPEPRSFNILTDPYMIDGRLNKTIDSDNLLDLMHKRHYQYGRLDELDVIHFLNGIYLFKYKVWCLSEHRINWLMVGTDIQVVAAITYFHDRYIHPELTYTIEGRGVLYLN